VKDASGKTTKYSYDGLNRVTLTERPNNISTSFTYDGEGRVTSLTNYNSFTSQPISTYAYTYDGQGYITTEKATEYVSALPSLTGLSDPLTGGSFLMLYGWGRMNASLYKNLKNGNGAERGDCMKKTRYFLLILTLIFGMTSCTRQQSSKCKFRSTGVSVSVETV